MNRMMLVLASFMEHEQELSAFLESQQDKDSPTYHKWLTPDEFASRFGPSEQDVAKVKQWLEEEGFQVNNTAQSRRWIEFSGNVGQVQKTFQTSIRKYVVQGEEHIANSTEISIPASLAPIVRGVLSLNDFSRKPMVSRYYQVARNADQKLEPIDPQFTNSNSSGTHHFLAPGDLAKIYNITPLYKAGFDGTGQTIAIAGRTNFQEGDVYMFRQIFGLPINDPITVVNGPNPVSLVTGDGVESSLDVEVAGALAPQATIKFVTSASTVTTDGIDLSVAYIVDHNLADIVSLSYGACEQDMGAAGNAFYSALWQQAAAQGMTVFVSSGDNGFAACDSASADNSVRGQGVNGLASTPFNIAVGGTQLNEGGNDATFWSNTNGSDLSSVVGYIPEVVWNETCVAPNPPNPCSGLWSGSGGISTVYTKPSWQIGTGVPADGKRDLPDVSLTAASGHDGYLVCYFGSCAADNLGSPGTVLNSAGVVGGTSASAPAMAGIFALINQKIGGGRQGAANWIFYGIANSSPANICDSSSLTDPLSTSTCSFNDITSGNNNVPGLTGATASGGYDLATGLGSVNAANLAQAWASLALKSTSTAFSLDATTLQHGSPVQATITVSGSSGTGTPTGSVVLMSDKNEPFATVPLTNGTFSGKVSTLPGGQFNVTAHYSGDDTFAASDSSPIAVNVSHEPSTISLSAYTYEGGPIPVSQIPYGNFIYFHVGVAGLSGLRASGGTVGFYEGQTQLGTIDLTSAGEGEFVSGGYSLYGAVICLPIGIHTVTASFEGNDSLDPSTSSSLTIEVTKATPSVYFSNLTPVTSPENAPLPVSVFVKGNGPILPTGTVQFYANGTPSGSPVDVFQASTGVTHEARATLSLAAGNYSISAKYFGDSVYLASDTSMLFGPLSVTVKPAPGTTTVTTLSMPNTMSPAGATNFAVKVTGENGTPTGTVTLSEPKLGVLTTATLTGGIANGTFSMSLPVPGLYTVAATYSGDATFAASGSTPVTVTVPRATPTIVLSSSKTSLKMGERFNLVTNVTDMRSSTFPQEAVQYYDSPDGSAAQPLGLPRILTLGPTHSAVTMIDSYSVILPQGTHTLTVQFLENWEFNSVTSAPITVEVAVPPDFTISQTSALPAITAGQSGSASLSFTPHGGFQGAATMSCSGLPSGTSCSFNPATVTLSGSPVPVTVSISTTAPSDASTATVAAHKQGLNPWWVFGPGLAAICFISTGRRRKGLFSVLTVLILGASTISCGGGGGSPPPPSGGGTTVSPTSTALSVSSLKAPQGTTLTLSATVSSTSTPTGTVTFFAGTDQLGSPVPLSSGVATLPTNSLPVGTHTISARYAGDAAHASSNSGSVRTVITGTTQFVVQVNSGSVQKTVTIPLTVQ